MFWDVNYKNEMIKLSACVTINSLFLRFFFPSMTVELQFGIFDQIYPDLQQQVGMT